MSRAAFEAWARGLEMNLAKYGPDIYSDCNTDFAWLAWQEAVKQERAKVEELEARIRLLEEDGASWTEEQG